MAIEVNRQTVSPPTIQASSEALRQTHIVKAKPVKPEIATEAVRQTIAAEQPIQAEVRQKLAKANEVVVQLQKQVQSVARQLDFRVDEESGRTLIKVTDRETGEVIREIPSEEMVELGQRLRELAKSLHTAKQGSVNELSGLLVKRQA